MLDVQHSMLSLRVDHVTTAHSLEPVKPCAPSIGIPPWLCLFRFLIIGRSVEGGYNRSSIFFLSPSALFFFPLPFLSLSDSVWCPGRCYGDVANLGLDWAPTNGVGKVDFPYILSLYFYILINIIHTYTLTITHGVDFSVGQQQQQQHRGRVLRLNPVSLTFVSRFLRFPKYRSMRELNCDRHAAR